LHKCSKAAGKPNHPAFVTEGAGLLQERKKDFRLLISLIPEGSDFLFFSSYKAGKPVRREFLTRKVNECLKKIGIEPGYFHTSHCFRVGYITKLLQITGELALIRQIIGHVNIQITSRYVEPLNRSQKEQ
jgi:site-specific recombinase XerD